METLVNEELVMDCLHGIGFQLNLTGYKMLKSSVPWYAQNNKLTAGKDIYPRLAREFDNISTNAVEQDICYAIRKAWKLGKREAWEMIFPGYTKAPSNMDFIATVAAYLQKNGGGKK